MTARNLYEGVLIELNKENAPNILLEDFNYFANKAINNYINKRYNIYDINQQTTDDLRVLKATALLPVQRVEDYKGMTNAGDDKMATYEAIMPSDYLHILNCICIYKVKKTYKCYNKDDTWRAAATRLTADMYSLVLDNFWNKPTYKKPYYYIHNVNTSNLVPTNPYNKKSIPILKKNEILRTTALDYIFLTVEGSDILYLYVYNSANPASSELFHLLKSEGGISKYANYKENVLEDKITYVENSLGLIANTDALELDSNNIVHIQRINKEVKINDNILIRHLNSENDITPALFTDDFGDEESLDVNGDFYVVGTGTDITKKKNKSFGKDAYGNEIVQGEGLPNSINIFDSILNETISISNIERGLAIRYGNVSLVRLEIRYGTDNTVFELTNVYVDYIKAPQNIRLTQQEVDLTEDTSQMLEYPDYVCQEIINELVHLVMENISDLRLQTHPVVTLSIANPTQALTPAQGLSAQ